MNTQKKKKFGRPNYGSQLATVAVHQTWRFVSARDADWQKSYIPFSKFFFQPAVYIFKFWWILFQPFGHQRPMKAQQIKEKLISQNLVKVVESSVKCLE